MYEEEPYMTALKRLFFSVRKTLMHKTIDLVEEKIKSLNKEIKEKDKQIDSLTSSGYDFEKLRELSKNLLSAMTGKAKKKREAKKELEMHLAKMDDKDAKDKISKKALYDKLNEITEEKENDGKDEKGLEGEQQLLQSDSRILPRMRRHRVNRNRPKVRKQGVRGTQSSSSSDNTTASIDSKKAGRANDGVQKLVRRNPKKESAKKRRVSKPLRNNGVQSGIPEPELRKDQDDGVKNKLGPDIGSGDK